MPLRCGLELDAVGDRGHHGGVRRRRSFAADINFFDAAGTSICAMRVVMAIAGNWGVGIPLDAFVATPTAADLARQRRPAVRHGRSIRCRAAQLGRDDNTIFVMPKLPAKFWRASRLSTTPSRPVRRAKTSAESSNCRLFRTLDHRLRPRDVSFEAKRFRHRAIATPPSPGSRHRRRGPGPVARAAAAA